MDYGVPLVGLDMGGASDGMSFQYQGLVSAFGREQADKIMSNIILLNYDGKSLPKHLKAFNPKFLLEAIPEILGIKKSHYQIFRESFTGIEIRSVTSGFPMAELGVGIAHPAFPHQINKVWEMIEEKPSDITQLFWALGMIPMEMTDNWSFVLDVLFCGLTLSAIRYNEASNMPFWKIDKLVRKFAGPNPFRAHDVIGAKGANFLTWSCLNDLSKHYGPLFAPASTLSEHKDAGSNWYPLNHLRPMVNWTLSEEEFIEMETWILGSIFQMTSLILHEKRSHLSSINAIGEICAQFRQGVLASIRAKGAESSIKLVESFQKLFPEAAKSPWHHESFELINTNEWQQLYVNAEHDGKTGVITISRESYNHDVNIEMNRAIDWFKAENIDRVIVTGDFHFSTQLVGADTSEFYPALQDEEQGFQIAYQWSKTARRLHYEFKTSVGFINGKRALGGMLELLLHCHYLVALDDSSIGAPEVTLPVVPGMELCHWPFRKSDPGHWNKLAQMLLGGNNIKTKNTLGWIVDYAGNMNDSIQMAWKLANEDELIMPKRILDESPLKDMPPNFDGIFPTENPSTIAARKAILDNIHNSCSVSAGEALEIQARHSAAFMISKECRQGFVGSDYSKTMAV
jgi:enoyl-CoA hydratase/carnithine racemase